MATPTIVGTAESAVGGSGARTVSVPAGTADGDLLVVVFASNDLDITPPGGGTWTAVKTNVDTGTLRTSAFRHVRAAGETTYAFTVGSSATTEWTIIALRDVDVASIVIGTDGTRAASGAAFVTTAPALTVPSNDCLVLCFATERTSNTEAGIGSVNNGFTQQSWAGHHAGVSSVESIWIGYKVIDAGTSGSVSVTYTQTQPSNGLAWLMAFPGIAPEPVEFGLWNGTSEDSVHAYLYDGVDEIPIIEIITIPEAEQSYTIAQMDYDLAHGNMVYWAHRGLSLEASEMTMRAYTDAIFKRFKVLEYSVQKTSDGVYVGMHDATLDRVTALTGNVSSKTWAELTGIAVDTGVADGGTISRLEDLLDTYGQTHVLVIEDKTYLNLSAVIALINSHITDATARVVLKFSGNSSTSFGIAAHAAGFKTWGYFYDAEATTEMPTKAVNYDYLGMNYNASGGNWTAALAYSKPIIAHVVPDATQAAVAIGKGAKGLQCSARAFV